MIKLLVEDEERTFDHYCIIIHFALLRLFVISFCYIFECFRKDLSVYIQNIDRWKEIAEQQQYQASNEELIQQMVDPYRSELEGKEDEIEQATEVKAKALYLN